jgi:hypothetical protein
MEVGCCWWFLLNEKFSLSKKKIKIKIVHLQSVHKEIKIGVWKRLTYWEENFLSSQERNFD